MNTYEKQRSEGVNCIQKVCHFWSDIAFQNCGAERCGEAAAASCNEYVPEGVNGEQLYYMQDKRQYVGNSVLWWAKDCRGYVCDTKKAHRFTLSEAMKHSKRETDVLWPVEYIDSRISYHMDMQHLMLEHWHLSMDNAHRVYTPVLSNKSLEANSKAAPSEGEPLIEGMEVRTLKGDPELGWNSPTHF